MESRFIGLCGKDVRRMAYQFAEKLGLRHTFNRKEQLAGVDWLRGFMNRHDLSRRKAEHTSAARINGFNPEAVKKFFDLLGEIFEEYQFPSSRIFNVDETGISTVPKTSPRIIRKRGKRQVSGKTHAERGETVSAALCMSAEGSFMHPMLIFPRVNENKDMLEGKPDGAWGEFHISGYMQSHIFTKWFKKFIEFSKSTPEEPVLLLLDGHATHVKNLEIIELAREHGVTILCFPPHTTHKLQPLDVGFMGPHSASLGKKISEWQQKGKKVHLKNLFKVIGKAYEDAAKPENAVSAFRRCGIFPFNPNIFTAEDFSNSNHVSKQFSNDQEKKEFEDKVSHFSKVIEEIRNDEENEVDKSQNKSQASVNLAKNTCSTTTNSRKNSDNNDEEFVLIPKSLISPLYDYLGSLLGISVENSDSVPSEPVSIEKSVSAEPQGKAPDNKRRGKAAITTSDDYRNSLIAEKLKAMKIEPSEDTNSTTFVRNVLLNDVKVPSKKKQKGNKRKKDNDKENMNVPENITPEVLPQLISNAVDLETLPKPSKRIKRKTTSAKPVIKESYNLKPVSNAVAPMNSEEQANYQPVSVLKQDFGNFRVELPKQCSVSPVNDKYIIDLNGNLFEISNIAENVQFEYI